MAIEVVRILEASGLRGHLVCIDGSSAFTKQLVLNAINDDHFTTKQLETTLLLNIASNCLPTVDLKTFNTNLNLLVEWNTKLQALIDFLTAAKFSVNEKTLLKIVTGFYNRIKAINLYTINDKIESDITLIRATKAAFADIDEMYELQSHTMGNVSLKYVEGCHFSLLESASIADIVNTLVMKLKL